MGKRADDKASARERIIREAARLLREKGIDGLKVADVMKAAGLTHGAFYAHFENKDALVEAAFAEALDHREAWLQSAAERPAEERLTHLLGTYLTARHRDTPAKGCAFASLAREFAQAGGPFPKTFERELEISLQRLASLLDEGNTNTQAARQTAMGLLSLCVGGMVLARAVESDELSRELLSAAADFRPDAIFPDIPKSGRKE